MRRSQQLGFALLERNRIKVFGGSLLKGNAKEKRPISIKKAMHLVIRSSRAKGRFSLLKKDIQIKRIISNQADRFGVRVYKQANAGNHLHLTVLPRSRAAFNGFIRAITGLIARTVLGTERGAGKGLQFWDQRPFTRILEWGREFKQVTAYLRQNTLEALGFEPYRPRSSRFNPSTA